jgi:hypothetical protein
LLSTALLLTVALRLKDYTLLSFDNTHAAHAAQVEEQGFFDEHVAKKSNGYEELAPATACLLDGDFVLAHLAEEELSELVSLL